MSKITSGKRFLPQITTWLHPVVAFTRHVSSAIPCTYLEALLNFLRTCGARKFISKSSDVQSSANLHGVYSFNRFTFDQTPACTLISDMNRLLKDGDNCDIEILVGPDMHPFLCHSVIVASRSCVFRELILQNRSAEKKTTQIALPNMTSKTFATIFHFMYTDMLNSDWIIEAVDSSFLEACI